jgi:Ser/Thr protein kinase RdoA (MazF antagonist)
MGAKMDMNKILKSWNIGNVSLIDPIPSNWGKTSLVITTDGRKFILKEKTKIAQMKQELKLLSSLLNVGASVAVPICAINGNHYVLDEGKTYCLYQKLPGKVIEEHFSGNAIARAKSFGRAIAFLHSCFLKCDNINGIKKLNLIEQIQEWAIPCIRKSEGIIDSNTVEETWKIFELGIVQLETNLSSQLIHRDLHPTNMLFKNGTLTGFVDFDMVVRGSRIFDVCYCGTSILVGGFYASSKREKWLELFQALIGGYQEMCPLSSSELQTIQGMLVAIELLFIAFSLETHTDGAAQCNARILDWLLKNKERILG